MLGWRTLQKPILPLKQSRNSVERRVSHATQARPRKQTKQTIGEWSNKYLEVEQGKSDKAFMSDAGLLPDDLRKPAQDKRARAQYEPGLF